jgi:cystathionine beta-lyase/cystathionine gamma-synthase
MRFELLPIAEIAALAKARGILTALDNTVATPLLQKPLTLGVDIALHSLTKYIGGHSDAMGGAVVGSAELIERIFYKGYMLLGAAMAPHDAWLHLRGLMTLPTRLARQQADALAVARFLADHPKVRRVFHPALADDPRFAEQMPQGHSGLLAAEFDLPDHAATLALADRLKLFAKAISWGGVESLVTTPHKTDPGPDMNRFDRFPRTMMRFSIGLEGAAALIADLDGALASCRKPGTV